MTAQFPFSAVVGQEEAKLALLVAALDPRIGGVLLRGQKGSAKTTLARGVADLLPGSAPFVELPLGATEDRVVGSLDLAAALTGGEVRFRPGLLAAAHGGVLYVDEVNLLADHLVDVLLDVASSGVNRVEREGIAHAHPSRFLLVGSMNPEEGELRPQLLDRFGLAVDVVAGSDPTERAEAVRRRLAFDADPETVAAAWAPRQREFAERLATAAPSVVTPELTAMVSALCAEVGAESLRADLVTCRAAAALAGLEGRAETTTEDVRRVAPLALAHRRRRQPFERPGMDQDELDGALDRAIDRATGTGGDEGGRPRAAPSDEPAGPAERPPAPAVAPGPPAPVVPLQAPRAVSGADGRRSPVTGERGRLVGDRDPADAPVRSVAVAATVRAAAARRVEAAPGQAADERPVEAGDVREAVRERRAGNLVILVVDASGSMGAERRMEAAKTAVMSLLLDAYQRRDRVAMVTFRGEQAEVALRPTGSVEVARARLAELATGGRTPLAAGISAALRLAVSTGGKEGDHRPLLVVVSDGRATSGPHGADPVGAAMEAAAAVRRRSVPAVVVDVEAGAARLGLGAELAAAMGARHVPVGELSGGALTAVIREQLPRP
ncbi:MAG TPA: ATP-binding protein [Acidimicrobiales bacterium]|nr:ATP-binding protein [Acidimicrobiales bacterium]